jgi:hypothetical protein
MRATLAICLAALTAAAAGCTRGRDDDHFVWRGTVPAGETITIRNTTGAIRVEGGGDEVEVRAVKHYRGPRPQRVRFVAVEGSRGATVCAVWGSGGECSEDAYRSTGDYWVRLLTLRSRVSVDFTVTVPEGVRVDASTVNGPISVDGADAPVIVATVNGPIKVSTSAGPVKATTVNGPIIAHVDDFAGPGPMELTTVNGSVVAELPDALDAALDIQTVNGHIQTDYPITVSGPTSRTHLRGTVGDGGRKVKIETVNGGVELRKGA